MQVAYPEISKQTSFCTACFGHISRRVVTGFCIAFVAVFLASVVGQSNARAETRTLKMYFTHTKESATITFKRNGKYVASGLRKANRFLRDWRRKEPTKMDPKLLDLVWEVYQKSGSRKPIHVISGYRSPRTNNMLRRRGRKVARNSQHTQGKALDFFMPDVGVDKLRALGLKAHRGGVGYYRGSFVHLDTGRVRHWPRMSSRQLARVFPRGKTIHVPSNGKPLKGYKTAMANLKAGRNADGSRRSTSVRPSLLASIFKRNGSGGDEDESAVAAKPAAKPKPKVAKPKKVEPKPAPTVVAAAPAPKPATSKPGGVDPFNVELTAAQKARAEAEKELSPDAVLASLETSRLAVPRLRPGSEKPKAETVIAENEAETVAPVEVALASPPALTNALRPADPVADAADAEKVEAAEALKSRVTTALARKPELSSSQRAAVLQASLAPEPSQTKVDENVLRPALAKAARDKTVSTETASDPAKLTPSQTEVARIAREASEALQNSKSNARKAIKPKDAPVLQASLTPQDQIVPAQPVWRKDKVAAKTSTSESGSAQTETKQAKITPAPERLAVPSQKPSAAQPKGNTKTRDTEPTQVAGSAVPVPTKIELSLGDLDGRSVKYWAVATSTRVGSIASLRAPIYKSSTSRAAPVSVYSKGFDGARFPRRADSFSGKALTRVAFAYFDTNN